MQDIREAIEERDSLKRATFFVWVKGHANDEGNIQADRLAVDGARMGRGVSEEGDREADEASGSDSDGDGLEESSDYGRREDARRSAVVDEDDALTRDFETLEQAMAEDADDKIE